MTTIAPSTKQREERLSALFVIAVALIAILLGAVVKNSAQNQTRPFRGGGVAADLPVGWLVQEGTGDLVLVARNTQSLDQLYRVNLLPDGALSEAATHQNEMRAGMDDSFRVVEETPIIVRGRDGYRVRYAFVDDNQVDIPTVIEGVSYYFQDTNGVLVLSYEAESNTFEDGVPLFQQFRASVTPEGGS